MEYVPDLFCSFMDSFKNMNLVHNIPRNLTPIEVSKQTLVNNHVRIGENVYDANGKFIGWGGDKGNQGCAGPMEEPKGVCGQCRSQGKR